MNELTDLMERSTDDLRPDVAALVAGGMTRGRGLRRRRRAVTATGVVAGVATVGAVALFAPSVVAGSSGGVPSSGGTPIQVAASSPAQRTLPTRDALANGSVVSLPSGESTLIDARGGRGDDFVAASWKFAPASGGAAGRLDVLVEAVAERPGQKVWSQTYSARTACQADVGTCRELPDGSWLSSFTMPEPLSGGGASEIIGAHATRWTADGFMISATAYNAMGEKYTAVTRSTPVLDEAQLAALVRGANLG